MNYLSIVTERIICFVTEHFTALVAAVIIAAIFAVEAVWMWPFIVFVKTVLWP